MQIGIIAHSIHAALIVESLRKLEEVEIVGVKEEPIHYITNVYDKDYDVRPFKFVNTEPWNEYKHSPYKKKKASIKRKQRK